MGSVNSRVFPATSRLLLLRTQTPTPLLVLSRINRLPMLSSIRVLSLPSSSFFVLDFLLSTYASFSPSSSSSRPKFYHSPCSLCILSSTSLASISRYHAPHPLLSPSIHTTTIRFLCPHTPSLFYLNDTFSLCCLPYDSYIFSGVLPYLPSRSCHCNRNFIPSLFRGNM